MWFWFAIITLLCWSGSDFFSKIGCRDASDKYAHFKMVMAVGLVMGLHAAYQIVFADVAITWEIILKYLPVSLLYILSMTLGYVGLRYIELSISSPICNASGALVAIIAIVSGTAGAMDAPQYIAIALACLGVIGLGIVEAREDPQLRAARQEASNYKYAKSFLALALPVAYCILDAAGTFADDMVLEVFHLDFIQQNVPGEFAQVFTDGIPEFLIADSGVPYSAEFLESYTPEQGAYLTQLVTSMSEASAASANVAYELTFFAAGLASFVYTVLIKRQRLTPKMEAPKYIGATFETVGQLFYIYALADGTSALAAPIISSYCMVSVLWSRLFLKEKLSWKHYVCIAITFLGIIIMGVYDM